MAATMARLRRISVSIMFRSITSCGTNQEQSAWMSSSRSMVAVWAMLSLLCTVVLLSLAAFCQPPFKCRHRYHHPAGDVQMGYLFLSDRRVRRADADAESLGCRRHGHDLGLGHDGGL